MAPPYHRNHSRQIIETAPAKMAPTTPKLPARIETSIGTESRYLTLPLLLSMKTTPGVKGTCWHKC
jgi:hypothetical protein